MANVPVALVLEDEPLISVDLETMLSTEGFQVSTGSSCSEASSWLDAHRPLVAIVDIELRDGVCTDVASRLVEAGIPFVVYTANDPSYHRGTPFAHGTWVKKPASDGQIVDAVRAALTGPVALPSVATV